MYKEDSELNNLQLLIYYDIKPKQTKCGTAQSAAAIEYTEGISAEG